MKCEICNIKTKNNKKICDTCDSNMKIMVDMDKVINKDIETQIKKDNKFLESINYLFSRRIKKFFKDEMEEMGGSGFKLVDKPKGEKQPGYSIEYYVDQWPVGDSGDCFEGYCYLQLANDKYLKWFYEC